MESLLPILIENHAMAAVILAGYINIWRAWANDRRTNQKIIASLIRKIGHVANAIEKSTHDVIAEEIERDRGKRSDQN